MILKIIWVDSGFSLDGAVWQSKEDIEDIVKELKATHTVGYLVYEDDDWLGLAQTVNDEQIRGGYLIYKKNIIVREELEK